MGKAVLRWKFFFVLWQIKNRGNRRKKHVLIFSLVVQASITYKVFFISLLSQKALAPGFIHFWRLSPMAITNVSKKLLNTYGIAILGKSWSLRSWIVRSWLVIVIITICLFPEQFFRYQRNGRCTHHCACNPNTYSNSEARGLGAIVQCRLKWI